MGGLVGPPGPKVSADCNYWEIRWETHVLHGPKYVDIQQTLYSLIVEHFTPKEEGFILYAANSQKSFHQMLNLL